MSRTALIFGVTGQAGSYLADLLLKYDYNVVGIRRRSASGSLWRLENALKFDKFKLVEGDITDYSSISHLLVKYRPCEIYNAAAQSHVHTSFSQPLSTWDNTAQGHLNLLEAVRQLSPQSKILFFASSEMFGTRYSISNYLFNLPLTTNPNLPFSTSTEDKFQNESTEFRPQSPYSIAKLAAFHATRLYRESYGLFACSGIFFNMESPRRGINFVTRKITSWFKNWNKHKGIDKLKLGNISSMRDWSYAVDSMRAAHLMLQRKEPKDYCIGTGETHSIKEFIDEVILVKGIESYFYDTAIEIDESLFRPAEVPYLRADASLAKKELDWSPRTTFKELVQLMVKEENGLP